MALSRLAVASTWFTNQLIDAAAIQSRILDLVNAAIDMLNGFQSDTEVVTIAAGQPSNTGAVTFANPYAAGVVPSVQCTSTNGSLRNTGITITARSNTGFSYRVFCTDGGNATSGGNAASFVWEAKAL